MHIWHSLNKYISFLGIFGQMNLCGPLWVYCVLRLNVVWWRLINWETESSSVMQWNAKYIAIITYISGLKLGWNFSHLLTSLVIGYWNFNTRQWICSWTYICMCCIWVSGADIWLHCSPNPDELHVSKLHQNVVWCCQQSHAMCSICIADYFFYSIRTTGYIWMYFGVISRALIGDNMYSICTADYIWM